MSLVNRYIGAPIKRVEDLRFLRGRGEYVADLARAEMLHAAILRSPVAHARIRAIDPRPALAIGGVHAVITAAEIGDVPKIPLRLQASPATEPFCQPVIARDRVRYVGEPIAVVLADSAARAEDGVEAIALEVEELPLSAIGTFQAGTRRCFSKMPAPTSPCNSRRSAAMPTRLSAAQNIPGARISPCSGTPHYPLSRVACSPNGMSRPDA
jgi:xanthine dehydrogenase molybdopterin-binding subunit B